MHTCKECEVLKPEGDFYTSNHVTCKECVKARVRQNRNENLAYYRSYDRMRYRENDERKEAARKSANSPAGLEARKRSNKRRREEEPEKFRARNAVANALRKGLMKRADKCFFCDETENLHAHHADYSRPLDVHWLCPACHGKLHAINGDFLKPVEAA